MRVTKKHKQFSIEEKNKLVKMYLDRKINLKTILEENDLSGHQQFYKWVKQYREFGTCVDRRGKASKKGVKGIGRPRKYTENLEDLSKAQLIERIELYEDIKKSLAYLKKEQQNKNTK